MAKGNWARLGTDLPPPTHTHIHTPFIPLPKFIPFKNRPTTFHFFFLRVVGYSNGHVSLSAYGGNKFRLLPHPISQTKAGRKRYFLHSKLTTAGENFSCRETNLSSHAAGMQKTPQSLQLVLQPSGHFQHPDAELLTLHIQPLLCFCKTSQFFLVCRDVRIAMQRVTIVGEKWATCCAGQKLQLCQIACELWQDFL